MAGTRSQTQSTVAGKRVRAPSGSPPRIAEDLPDDFHSILRFELAAQDERFRTVVSQIEDKHKRAMDQMQASHRAAVQRLTGQLDRALDEMAQLRGAAESRDRESRASHLIIKGLPEESNDQSVFQAVSQLFPTPNGETPIAVTEARRLGRPREGAPEVRPRAVLVKFTSVPSKHAALKHSKTLRSRKIYLDSDLTPQQREIRIQKRDRFQQLKTQNMRPFWRDERLFCYKEGRVVEDRAPPGPPAPQAPATSGPTPMDTAGPSYVQVARP